MQVSVERLDDKRLIIRPVGFLGPDEFAAYLRMVKSVPGTRFSKTHRAQLGPLDMEVCRQLREVFGKALRVGNKLADWARDEIVREQVAQTMKTVDLSHEISLPVIERDLPEMYAAMRRKGYQLVAPAFAAQAGWSYLNGDQPGLGKCLETFAVLVESGVKGVGLVIAPRTSLTVVWKAEVEKWLAELPGGAAAYVADGPRAQREQTIAAALASPARLTFLMVNAEMCRLKETTECVGAGACDGTNEYCEFAADHKTWRFPEYDELHAHPWAFQVADEIHRYMVSANPRSKKPSAVGLGLQRLPRAALPDLSGDAPRLPLSGTPFKGRLRNLWPVLHWMYPDKYSSQWRWLRQYCKTAANPYSPTGDMVTDELIPEREAGLDRELSRVMLRRTKDELRTINPEWAPPPKEYYEVWVDLTPQQRKAYTALVADGTAQVDGGKLSANGTLALMTRLQQLAGCYGKMAAGQFVPQLPSAKFDWLSETFLPKLGITGDPKTETGDGKVIIASQYTQFINLWAKALRDKGIRCHVLTGETSDRERVRQVQDFQRSGGPRVFLLNTMAGGVSVTLDAANDVVIMDETDVPDDQEQVEDRAHRTSNVDHHVNVWYVRARGTIEEQIMGNTTYKDTTNRRVLDWRRGIEIIKERRLAD